MKFYLSLGAAGVVIITLFVMYSSYSNQEVELRNQITAVQRDLHNELDATTKKISQTAQVTAAQMSTFKDIIVGNSRERGGSKGSLATMVHESAPDLAPTTASFTNLQNIISGARDHYAQQQKLLLGLKEEHDNVRLKIPSSFFVGGRPEIIVVIVTSSRAEESFRTGVDDDDSVFKGPK